MSVTVKQGEDPRSVDINIGVSNYEAVSEDAALEVDKRLIDLTDRFVGMPNSAATRRLLADAMQVMIEQAICEGLLVRRVP